MSERGAEDGRSFVFAYGSNLDPARMSGRVPSARFLGRSRLEGFELRFHKRGWEDGTGKADAYATGDPDHVVHGVVYEVLDEELLALDVHETGYERRLLRFSVESQGESRSVGAWVYLALPDRIDDSLLPLRCYLDHVLTGAREHGLPVPLIQRLEHQPTLD